MLYNCKDYRPSLISQKAGVYVFRDGFGKIIYVGKAKNLRKRMASYFRPSNLKTANIKLRCLINSIEQFEFFEVKSESEALLLEAKFIKDYMPEYNILLRDDKRFLMIKVNLKEAFPRLILVRVRKDDGANYFGPFPQTKALKQTVEYLTRYFGLRSCTVDIPTEEDKRHCHKAIISICSAPCDKTISQEDYNGKVRQVIEILNGDNGSLINELKDKMQLYAEKHQFEKAALTRDVVDNLLSLFKGRNFAHSRIKLNNQDKEEGLEELQKVLKLSSPLFIMEAFDNSHFQGQYTVSSMVRFINGKPHNKSYRHYKIKSVSGIDDFAAMNEVVYRRYKRILEEKRVLPNLILIDGGKGQVNAAYVALQELGLEVPMIGLAKRQEEIFFPHQSEPLILEHCLTSLKLLQHIRDEAHRFAISFHRQLRDKSITNSILDDIENIGENRKKSLLKAFGSVAKIRKASVNEISQVSGISKTLATEVSNYLKRKFN